MINKHTKLNTQLLDSASSNSVVKSSSRKLLNVFSTLFLSLLLGSSILRACSYLPTYDIHPQFYVYDGVFTGRRFLTTALHARRTADDWPARDETSMYCDRSHLRTDICVAKGDVRVNGQVGSVVVFSESGEAREEKVRPYTRKWEESVMKTIDEVSMRRDIGNSSSEARVALRCDVKHDVPAIVFSTGGYTGNVYHEFNDGLIPLFITAQHLKGDVVLIILEYHDWWMSKYGEIVGQITKHEVLDFARDKRVHCFPEVTVGLRIHDELAIHPHQHGHGHGHHQDASMQGFQTMLHSAYLSRLQGRSELEAAAPGLARSPSSISPPITKPKLVIISRESPRAMLNQMEVVSLAEEIGFFVHVLAPKPTTEMVDIYLALSTCDVMMGVHGAAMTHLLFMRPATTFIQVVPLGTDWAAATYYGEPAQKLGLNYVEYKVSALESSLSEKYAMDDPVLADPDSVNSKGWWETKRIYLEGQDVRLSLERVGETLRAAYARAVVTSSVDLDVVDQPCE